MNKFESLIITISCIREIKPLIKKWIKYPWILFIIKSYFLSMKIFKKTKWYNKKDDESKYVESMALLPAIYLKFKKKYNEEKALEIMNDIIIKVSFTVDNLTSKKHYLFSINNPFERWIKYRSILITEGFGLYNDVEDVYISKNRMHYVVKRCIFHDFFEASGTPELTKIICDYDKLYHSSIFKEFYFDRNGDWENTIGYGNDMCHYVWKDKRILSNEFKKYIFKNNSKNGDSERRNNIRRQYDRRQYDRRQFSRRNKSRRNEDSID